MSGLTYIGIMDTNFENRTYDHLNNLAYTYVDSVVIIILVVELMNVLFASVMSV